ncbi:hypothetical protein DSOL_2806 [Desulfosporosinus metallidurans]|uniref:Uncharacterized protein n=1 Tax=Desulfosporosinus metallidurans TaxID=1888891 RepID=A0A1Q8QV39_9FIRM|nr:hypothetical protein DSOL_2806 [Desulfosporosinus metallidurans]
MAGKSQEISIHNSTHRQNSTKTSLRNPLRIQEIWKKEQLVLRLGITI